MLMRIPELELLLLRGSLRKERERRREGEVPAEKGHVVHRLHDRASVNEENKIVGCQGGLSVITLEPGTRQDTVQFDTRRLRLRYALEMGHELNVHAILNIITKPHQNHRQTISKSFLFTHTLQLVNHRHTKQSKYTLTSA